MLTVRVIPCLDVREGLVVKGIRFAGLRDVGSPVGLALYHESHGADEIVVLDVSATNRNRQTHLQTVHDIREVLSIPLTVGGGIRSLEDVRRLTDAGADRVSLNSAAVATPQLVAETSNHFGRQCTVVAIDAVRKGDSWQVLTHSGEKDSGLDVVQWASRVENLGAGEILLTSFDQDGTRSGYDCELIQAVTSEVSIPVIASGGADSASHMREGLDAGASAVLAASILHDRHTTVAQLKQELQEMGVAVRL